MCKFATVLGLIPARTDGSQAGFNGYPPERLTRSVGRGTEVSIKFFQMFFTYVLFSEGFKRFYKGHCKDLELRLSEHNSGRVSSTKHFIPWRVIYFESFPEINEAIKREKYFKSAAGRRFLKKQIPH